MKIKGIKKIAKKYGWKFLAHQEETRLISFTKIILENTARINIQQSARSYLRGVLHKKISIDFVALILQSKV